MPLCPTRAPGFPHRYFQFDMMAHNDFVVFSRLECPFFSNRRPWPALALCEYGLSKRVVGAPVFMLRKERWEPPHLCGGRSALALCERVSTLITRFPGFPVQFGGSGALLAAFLNESRIRGRVQRSVQEIRVHRWQCQSLISPCPLFCGHFYGH